MSHTHHLTHTILQENKYVAVLILQTGKWQLGLVWESLALGAVWERVSWFLCSVPQPVPTVSTASSRVSVACAQLFTLNLLDLLNPGPAWPTRPGGWEEVRQAVNGKASICLAKVLAEGRALFPLPRGRWLPACLLPTVPATPSSSADILLLLHYQNDCRADVRLTNFGVTPLTLSTSSLPLLLRTGFQLAWPRLPGDRAVFTPVLCQPDNC